MTMKKILAVDQNLMSKIEDNRGELDHDEFVELCVDNCVEEGGIEENHQTNSPLAYVTKDEFKHFEGSVKHLLGSLVDFSADFGPKQKNKEAVHSTESQSPKVVKLLKKEPKPAPVQQPPVRERYYPEEELPMRRPVRERYYPEEELPMRRAVRER
ncbi:MAG: hypothetical protein J7K77_01235, partial [Dehalococcoidales bacterium]|nr:hypothetical protein [Dehalococcoidales bacterium]